MAAVRMWVLIMLSPAIAAAQPTGFDPIEPGGWPTGLTLTELRELPECGIDGLPHVPGAAVTCRPPVIAGPVQWSLGVDWTTGVTFGAVATLGGAHALGVESDFAVSRAFELGARYELMGIAVPMDSALSNQFLGLVKYRLFTDESGRSAWTLGGGGGYALRGGALGGSAPLARVSLARELGMYLDDANAVTATVELAYEQSFGDARLSAVLASLRGGFETQIRAPADLGRPAPTPWRHAASFDVLAGPYLGFGVSLELRPAAHVSVVTTADYLFDITRDGTLHGYDGAAWSTRTGLRLEGSLLYLQAQAGAAWVGHDPRGELRAIAQGELGVRALAGCSHAVDLGAWLRAFVDNGVDVTAGGLMLRVVFGSGRDAAADNGWCAQRERPRLAMPPPAVTEPPPPPTPDHTITVDLTPPKLAVPEVHVVAPPIVIEVDLGAQLFGVQVRIDPRALPLDRLRAAGRIEVELSGPPEALASFRAELDATLGRSGIRVAGWTTAPSTSSVVHARFTLR